MSRVRHAGHLIKEENGAFENYWCVVRDRAFIIYPCHGNNEEVPLEVNTTPICSLPISHLSATAYVLPAITKRNPSQYSLELECAASGREFTFYADKPVALEKWVDAIKFESSKDDITPQDSPHGALLPPEMEVNSLISARKQTGKRDFESRYAKETLSTKYLEHIRANSQHENIFNQQPVFHTSMLDANTYMSMQAENLSLTDVTPANYDGDISGSLTPLSSPAPSTPPNIRHHNYQDSADESSVSSSATSSPLLGTPQSFLRSSFTRQRTNPKREKRQQTTGKGNRKGTSHVPTALDNEQLKRKCNTESSSNASSLEDGRSSNPYFYTGSNGMKRGQSPPGIQYLLQSTSKRHTICELSKTENVKLSGNPSKTGSQNLQPTRHSIAPISSLDLQLSQRSRTSRQHLSSLQNINRTTERDSNSESDESTSCGEDLENTRSQTSKQPRTFFLGVDPRDTEPDLVSHDHKKTAAYQTRDEFNNTTDITIPSPTSTEATQQMERIIPMKRTLLEKPHLEDSRRKSGNFGSRVINRVSSVVGKRTKSTDEAATSSSLASPYLLRKNCPESISHPSPINTETLVSGDPLKKYDDNHSRLIRSIITAGWLYRKKRVKWTKYWTVLYSDKTLYFYRDDQHTQNSDASSVVDLNSGCDVRNVVQDKSSNGFTLIQRKPMIKSDDTRAPTNQDSNSKDFVKRVQLMCKSNQEFNLWVKSFVVINSSPSSEVVAKMSPVRTLKPIKQADMSVKSDKLHDPVKFEFNNNLKMHLQENNGQEFHTMHQSRSMQNLVLSDPNIGQKKVFKKSSSFNANASTKPTILHKSHDQEFKKLASGTVLPSVKIDEEQEKEVSSIYSTQQHLTLSKRNPDQPLTNVDETKERHMLSGKLSTFYYEDIKAEASRRKSRETSSTASLVSSSSVSASEEETSADMNALTELKSNSEADMKRTYSLSDIITAESVTLNTLASSRLEKNKGKVANEGVSEKLPMGREINILYSRSESNQGDTCDNAKCNCHHASNNCDFKSKTVFNNKSRAVHLKAELQSSMLEFNNRNRESEKESNSLPFSLVSSRPVTSSNIPENYESERDHRTTNNNESSDSVEHSLKVLDRVKLFEKINANINQFTKAEIRDKPFEAKYNQRAEGLVSPKSSRHSTRSHKFSRDTEGRNFESTDAWSPLSESCNSVKAAESEGESSPSEDVTTKFDFQALRRWNSDSNILEPTNGASYRMRTIKKAIPILTHIDILEIYGPVSKRYTNQENFKSCPSLPSKLREMRYEERRHSVDSDISSCRRKSSTDASSSAGSTSSIKGGSLSGSEGLGVASLKSSESCTSDSSSRSERRKNWFSNVTPSFSRSLRKSIDGKPTSKHQILQIPASSFRSASHSGYLDRKNKKKQWDRFWCVYHDSCLYCYNSPQSEVTRDAIVLRGYEVIADVMNMNRTRFEFQVVQQGIAALHFSTDNHEEFLLWVGSLERESQRVPSPTSCSVEDGANKTNPPSPLPLNSLENSKECHLNLKKPAFHERLKQEMVEMQKQQLLNEIASQQEILLRENQMLDSISAEKNSSDPFAHLRQKWGRIEVIEKFDRQRETEESIATKSMALLNRRRNSAQLKVDQLAREIAPKSGKKRRQNHQQFSALEAKLNEMKEKLRQVDTEIQALQANKQNALEKIREKQDLELFLAEQQDSLSIMRRLDNDVGNGAVSASRQRNPRKALASIEEQEHSFSTIDLRKSESSDSVDSGRKGPNQSSSSTHVSFPLVFDESESEGSSSLASSSAGGNPFSVSKSSPNLLEAVASSTPVLSKSENTTSKQHLKKKDNVDPSVLAGIEQFELFSKQMMEKLKTK